MMFPKPPKKVVLKGEAIRKLNEKIHERDGGRCVYCSAPVDIGVKFHHERIAGLKSDVETQGVLLCYDCHTKRHNDGEISRKIKEFCRKYLEEYYGTKLFGKQNLY